MTRGEKRQGHSSPPANAVLVLEGSTSSTALCTTQYLRLLPSSRQLTVIDTLVRPLSIARRPKMRNQGSLPYIPFVDPGLQCAENDIFGYVQLLKTKHEAKDKHGAVHPVYQTGVHVGAAV